MIKRVKVYNALDTKYVILETFFPASTEKPLVTKGRHWWETQHNQKKMEIAVWMCTFALTEEMIKWMVVGNKSARPQSRLVLNVHVCTEVDEQSCHGVVLFHCGHVQRRLVSAGCIHKSTWCTRQTMWSAAELPTDFLLHQLVIVICCWTNKHRATGSKLL